MTRDDIIRVGQKVGLLARTDSLLARETLLIEMLGRFASIVAAHERAECEAICVKQSLYYAEQDRQAESGAAGCCSVLIRSRGEK